LKLTLTLESLGLWGAGKETFKASTVTFKAYVPAIGGEVLAISGPYIKGLIRGWTYRIAPLLIRNKIIKGKLVSECTSASTCGECIVCKVFGYSGGVYSPIKVSNFYAIDPKFISEIAEKGLETSLLTLPNPWYSVETGFITHIRIDDVTGKVAPGALFVVEIAPPGTTFYGEIELMENLIVDVDVDDARRLLLASISQLNQSYIGRRSRGRISVIEVEPQDIFKDDFCSEVFSSMRR